MTDADKPDPLIGTVVAGRYHIEKRLGAGGMGAVYLALQSPLSRRVALKVMLDSVSRDATAAARFEQEARAASLLNHPNIVTVHDFGRTDDGLLYMSMELVDGLSLRDIISRDGALPYPRALAYVTGICRALAEAHAQGIVHRDLKPDNAMLIERQHDEPLIKVLDFGLAKILEGNRQSPTLTQQRVIMGTPAYMAPEQIHGMAVDARTDLYALGILFWELLVGRPPFMADSPINVLLKHLAQPLPSLAQAQPGRVPPGADALITQLCAKDATQRPATSAEVLQRLRALAADGWTSQPAGAVALPSGPGWDDAFAALDSAGVPGSPPAPTLAAQPPALLAQSGAPVAAAHTESMLLKLDSAALANPAAALAQQEQQPQPQPPQPSAPQPTPITLKEELVDPFALPASPPLDTAAPPQPKPKPAAEAAAPPKKGSAGGVDDILKSYMTGGASADDPVSTAAGYLTKEGVFVPAKPKLEVAPEGELWRQPAAPAPSSIPVGSGAPRPSAPSRLQTESSRPLPAPSSSSSERASRVQSASTGSAAGASLGRIVRLLAIVAVVGVAVAVGKDRLPALLEGRAGGGDVGGGSDAFAPFARRAGERLLADLKGAPPEPPSTYLERGLAQLALGDTLEQRAAADVELRHAVGAAPDNVAALAAWVENAASLPAVRAHPVDGGLVKEAASILESTALGDAAALRARGALLLADGDVDGARALLRKAAAAPGGAADARTQRLLARALMTQSAADKAGDAGKRQAAAAEALAAARAAHQLGPDAPAAALVLSRALTRAGQPREARRALEERILAAPADVDAALALARLNLTLGLDADAGAALAGAADSVDATVLHALVLHRLGQSAKAADVLEKTGDTSPRVLALRAQALLAAGNAPKAKALAQQAVEASSSPSSAASPAHATLARLALGEAKRRLGAADAVDTLLRAADGDGPAAVEARLAAGEALVANGDATVAITVLAKSAQDPRALVLLMVLDASRGQPEAAMKHLDALAAVAAAPRGPLDERGELVEAPLPELIADRRASWARIAARAQALPRDKDLAGVRAVALAACAFFGGADAAAAATALESAFEATTHPALLLWAGIAQVERNRAAAAVDALQLSDAKAVDAVAVQRSFWLARAQRDLGKGEAARATVARLVATDPRAPIVLGEVWERADNDRARAAYADAWAQDPSWAGALRGLWRVSPPLPPLPKPKPVPKAPLKPAAPKPKPKVPSAP